MCGGEGRQVMPPRALGTVGDKRRGGRRLRFAIAQHSSHTGCARRCRGAKITFGAAADTAWARLQMIIIKCISLIASLRDLQLVAIVKGGEGWGRRICAVRRTAEIGNQWRGWGGGQSGGSRLGKKNWGMEGERAGMRRTRVKSMDFPTSGEKWGRVNGLIREASLVSGPYRHAINEASGMMEPRDPVRRRGVTGAGRGRASFRK